MIRIVDLLHACLAGLVLASTIGGCDCAPRARPGGTAPAPSAAPHEPGVVSTDSGALRGKPSGSALAFLGIPYAAPPVGPLRWKPPRPREPWSGVRDATAFGPECPQLSFDGTYGGGSEDCLTLNVWAPAAAPAAPLPVIVFIHGGYNVRGSASKPRDGVLVLDGSYTAEHGPAVVMTVQYRLGALGFLAHRALAAEDPGHNVGNFGLLDQIAALAWVQRNIRAFGGDPARVLVHGYSAGSIDTCSLLVSPLAKGLFSRAAMHSWPCAARSLSDQERDGDTYATTLGCAAEADVPACMRRAPVERAMAAGPSFGVTGSIHHGATIDGYVIPADPFQTIAAGKHHHVPLVIGTTSAEYQTLILHTQWARVRSEEDYLEAVHKMYPVKADAVLAQYPLEGFPSPREAMVQLLSDRNVVCPEKRIARLAAASQAEPVRAYVFTHAYDAPPFRPTPHGHGVDVPFLFHTIASEHHAPKPPELALAGAVVDAYLRFTATGDATAGGRGPSWPAYDGKTDVYLALDDTITTVSGYHAKQCAFWEEMAAPDAH
jgi:para-nitrobenzyl esterase